ncbi:hypothetical protein EJB05_44328, partial [Eragrostis curvula]
MAFAALFDPLYCPEEHLDLYQEEEEEAGEEYWPPAQRPRPAVLDDELPALFEALRGKEGAAVVVAAPATETGEEEDGYGGAAGREEAVGWACRAAARLGFSALTAALAAAYLDRCFLLGGGALRLVGEPWMARLAAVACVALAAKVEETRVPVLLDLQLCAAGAGNDADACVFEAKTVRRMELLVLSALGWRMHPVTPFSYLEPLLADAAARRHHCEGVLLAVIADWRWPRHRPSAWAAAALLATAGSADDDSELLALINAPEVSTLLHNAIHRYIIVFDFVVATCHCHVLVLNTIGLDASQDEVAECAKIISEATGMCFLAGDITGSSNNNKRKHAAAARMYSPPLSPSGVIGALSGFSCESSSSSFDSRAPAVAAAAWPASAPVSVSSSPEHRPAKRAAVAPLLPPDEESRDAWPSTCAA